LRSGRKQGKANDECRAFADFSFTTDRTAVFIHDHRVGNGQPLACSFAHSFRGKERVKDFCADCFGNARASVADANLDSVSLGASANRDSSFAFTVVLYDIGNGVGRINDEVKDNLVNFAR